MNCASDTFSWFTYFIGVGQHASVHIRRWIVSSANHKIEHIIDDWTNGTWCKVICMRIER